MVSAARYAKNVGSEHRRIRLEIVVLTSSRRWLRKLGDEKEWARLSNQSLKVFTLTIQGYLAFVILREYL